jgi:hypothetical protein
MELLVILKKLHHKNCTLRKALSALWINANLTILTADKGNDSVIINTSDFSWKIGAFLEEPS